MEIKYEAVFGDQALFDGAIFGSIAVIANDSLKVYFDSYDKFLTEVMKCNDLLLSELPVFAMRRIIQEPKRWTMQDKLAGRLPEVGSMIWFINDMKQVEFAGTDGGNYLWYFKRDSGAFGSAYFNCFKPIETPEEKAQRERNEWAKKASQFIDDELDCVNIVGEHVMRRFYNALKSGELPVPVKDAKK